MQSDWLITNGNILCVRYHTVSTFFRNLKRHTTFFLWFLTFSVVFQCLLEKKFTINVILLNFPLLIQIKQDTRRTERLYKCMYTVIHTTLKQNKGKTNKQISVERISTLPADVLLLVSPEGLSSSGLSCLGFFCTTA